MKKAIALFLTVALTVCMMPAMAFAADGDAGAFSMKDNEKVKLELKSGQTTATVTATDDYKVVAEVNGTTVDKSGVKVTLGMQNVAGLGITDMRKHEVNFSTGLDASSTELKNHLENVLNFAGCTINGTVDGNAFVYTVAKDSTVNTEGQYKWTATPNTADAVRAAWQKLTGMVEATTGADDSKITIKHGTYLQIGTEKLTFDEKEGDCTIDNISTGAGLGAAADAVKEHAKLDTNAKSAVKNIEIYLPKGTTLQVGSSSATLTRDLYIRSDADLNSTVEGKGPLEALREAANAEAGQQMTQMIKTAVGLFNQAASDLSTKTVSVDILGGYTVSFDDKAVTVPYGTDVAEAVKLMGITDKQFNETGAVTENMTLTEKTETPGPVGPSVPVGPSDNVTNSGTAGSDNAVTNADLAPAVSADGKANAAVDQTTADRIVEKAAANNSKEVVLDVKTDSGKADATTVAVPTETLKKLVEKTDAAVTVKTDAGNAEFDQKAVETVAAEAAGATVEIIVEKTKDEEDAMHFELKVVSGGKVIGEFKGGKVSVTVKLNAALAAKPADALTCVYIDDEGKYTDIGGIKNADNTFTFVTDHFSGYAVMDKQEAGQTIEAQKNDRLKKGVENTAIKLYYNKKEIGKGWIKLRYKKSYGYKVDNYEIFRSAKKKTNFGDKPWFVTKKNKVKGYYTNGKSVKKGTRYYYKMRGVREIAGEKVYTKWSNTVMRTGR